MLLNLAPIANYLKAATRDTDHLVGVRVRPDGVQLAVTDAGGETPHIEVVAEARFPRAVDLHDISENRDMIANTIRTLIDEHGIDPIDANILVPSSYFRFTTLNLPYLTPAELKSDADDIEFWKEYEPDLSALDAPIYAYDVLRRSENDDLTGVLFAFCERALLQPWIDLALAAYLNPVFIEVDVLSACNMRYHFLSEPEKRRCRGLVHIESNVAALTVFSYGRVHTLNLEVSAFDLTILNEAREIDVEADLWSEIGARLSNGVKQAALYFQEEFGYPPMTAFDVICDESENPEGILALLDAHFAIAPIALWTPPLHGGDAKAGRFASAISASIRRLGTFGETDHVDMLCHLNLLPQRDTLLVNRQLSVITRMVTTLLIAASLIMILWSGVFVAPAFVFSTIAAGDTRDLQRTSELQSTLVDGLAQRRAALDKKTAHIEAFLKPHDKQHFLRELTAIVPEAVQLEDIFIEHAEDKQHVSIAGYSEDVGVVITLAGLMSELELADDVRTEIDGAKLPTRFRISGRLIEYVPPDEATP